MPQGNSQSLALARGKDPVKVCRDQDGGFYRITSRFDMVDRTVVVPDDENLPLRFEFAVDIRSRNNGELWASYRMEGIDSKNQQLCADVHGLQYVLVAAEPNENEQVDCRVDAFPRRNPASCVLCELVAAVSQRQDLCVCVCVCVCVWLLLLLFCCCCFVGVVVFAVVGGGPAAVG